MFGAAGSNTSNTYSREAIDEEWLRVATDVFTLTQCEALYVPTYSSLLTLPITLSVLRVVPVYFYRSASGTFVEMHQKGLWQTSEAARMRHHNLSLLSPRKP